MRKTLRWFSHPKREGDNEAMFSPEELGRALRLLRARRDLTQEEVATRATITKAMVSSYELGLKLPHFESLAAVLNALGEDFHALQEALAEIRSGRPASSSVQAEYLGQALRLLRKQRKVTQTAVAESAGITKAMLSCYETGATFPSLPSLAAVLEELKCDFHSLQEALLLVLPEDERPQIEVEEGEPPIQLSGDEAELLAEEDGARGLIAAFERLGEEGHTVYVELHPQLRSMNSERAIVSFKVTGPPPDRPAPGLRTNEDDIEVIVTRNGLVLGDGARTHDPRAKERPEFQFWKGQGLSTRASNALANLGIGSWDSLLKHNLKEVRLFPNMGRRSVYELQTKAAALGFKIAGRRGRPPRVTPGVP